MQVEGIGEQRPLAPGVSKLQSTPKPKPLRVYRSSRLYTRVKGSRHGSAHEGNVSSKAPCLKESNKSQGGEVSILVGADNGKPVPGKQPDHMANYGGQME